MFYDYPITIPHGTPQADPYVEEIGLVPGVVHQVEIGFPPGPAGRVHIQIWRAAHQMWPTNPGASFASDDYTVSFAEDEESLGPTETWSVRGWSPTAALNHTILVRLGILERQKTLLGSIAQALFGAPRR